MTMKKNAWQKSLLAELITSQTSIPQKCVAEQLHMVSSPYVNRLSKEMRTKLGKEKRLEKLKEKIIKIIT